MSFNDLFFSALVRKMWPYPAVERPKPETFTGTFSQIPDRFLFTLHLKLLTHANVTLSLIVLFNRSGVKTVNDLKKNISLPLSTLSLSEASCHYHHQGKTGYLSSSQDRQRSNAEPFGGECRSTLKALALDFQSIPCKAPLQNWDQPPSHTACPSAVGDPACW